METDKIITELNRIFIDVLDNPQIKLTPETTAADIEEWDSLTNIQIIVAIEKHFSIRFSSAEIQQFKDINGLCECISQKLKG